VLGERPDPALDAELRAAVAAIAGRWAVATAAPGRALASDRVAGADVAGTEPFAEPDPEAVAGALGATLAGHGGPVLLVAADVPRLDAQLAHAALGDLAAGCGLSFAPATDGRPFLLALPAPTPEALALIGARDRTREEVFAAAMALGGEVGMLRSERRVVTAADARALSLDPLVPPELRALARSR
jgi:non-ribosomal peptide synthetase component F